MNTSHLRGSIVPVPTPFKNGQVDESALQSLINWQIENGAHGISVTGTTGEPSSLSSSERMRVHQVAKEAIAGRAPFMPGTGCNNFEEAVNYSRNAEKIGADALLLIAPYYNRPSQEGLFRYFTGISSQVGIPVILYNIPGRTAVNIEPDTVARVVEKCPNVVGVKESNKDFEHINRLLHKMGREFLVYSGIELLCFPILAIGGAGFLSATANLLPSETANVYNLVQEGKWEAARELHYHMLPLNDAVFFEINPVPIKTGLGWMGKINFEVRLPLCEMSAANQERLRKVMQQYNML
ncbi:MAG: 4-hydroxy-tetrahydrodipicolinate synthase [Calditrichaeota bacterium]|nr:4-hydroxy-tetrahydrodipicolinate synthase [Calditrichota bacterium]MCB9367363.1 4-hydroxy-tetrahydrodipicolinate synthase [Calditrichota bacterium]MCB9391329.1 4-hydroxy-tetrahydrodipicolinate synthase [Calditrichota bacterium]